MADMRSYTRGSKRFLVVVQHSHQRQKRKLDQKMASDWNQQIGSLPIHYATHFCPNVRNLKAFEEFDICSLAKDVSDFAMHMHG